MRATRDRATVESTDVSQPVHAADAHAKPEKGEDSSGAQLDGEGPAAGWSDSVYGRVMLEKMTLYETRTKLYVIATDKDGKRFRILKIDRVCAPYPCTGQPAEEGDEEAGLVVTEDAAVYSLRQKDELVETLKAGNGGIKLVEKPCFGIAGFVRFTSSYHMILITKRSKVAVIGGHFVYHSEGTELHEISPVPAGLAAEDARQKNVFLSVHLSKNFYFSYTYDVTNTLQRNLLRGAESLPLEDKWVWNWRLLRPVRRCLRPHSPWILPLIHGFVDQKKLAVFGRAVYVTLIARRSRHFAGARFLRRGVNDQGFVANDVESEQIVAEALTTPFYSAAESSHFHSSTTRSPPLPADFPIVHQGRRPNPRYTAHVQCRGSIPLYWSQDVARALKPPIELSTRDPYYAAAAKHFDGLFRSYGGRVIVLNLIKHGDKRESTLLPEFKECVDYLNQFLPSGNEIDYITFDMSAANSGPTKNALGVLEDYAEGSIEKTGFFHSGRAASRRTGSHGAGYFFSFRFLRGMHKQPPTDPAISLSDGHFLKRSFGNAEMLATSGEVPHFSQEWSGPTVLIVSSTPCANRLVHPLRSDDDFSCSRTNAAQTMIAMIALGHQLHALGLAPSTRLEFDSDALKLLEMMYREHGDCIAIQYGGSNTVNTIDSYRPTGSWSGAWSGVYSRDKVESARRYYANSFGDHDKQAAIDLFLGIKHILPPPPSWEYLPLPPRPSYRDWYTPAHLASTPASLSHKDVALRLQATIDAEDERDPNELWRRYYRGGVWQTLDKQYQCHIQSTLPVHRSSGMDEALLSPFVPRRSLLHPVSIQRRHTGSGLRSWISHRHPHHQAARQSRHRSSVHDPSSVTDEASHIREAHLPVSTPAAPLSLPTGQLASALLKPVVRADEAREYVAWTAQFQHLSLAAHDHLSEKDRAMYTAHAASANAIAAGVTSDVSERDRITYQAFISGGKPRGMTTGDIGVSGASVKMYREMVEGGSL